AADPTWRVPGFQVDELLGVSASGEVWRARSVSSGETVALKRLHAPDEAAAARVRWAMGQVAAGGHPHLLRVRELLTVGSQTVLVLDHAAAGSLRALLRRRGRLRPGEVVTVVAPIAAALAQVHAAGLVHGAVTPDNVLFDSEGRPLLADLGVNGAAAAEPAQAAPEHADPSVALGGPLTPASDVFMLAAVAVHALTGEPPWRGTTVAETLGLAGAGAVPQIRSSAPTTPGVLVDVLEQALSPHPDQRPTMADLALDVRRASVPEPVRLVLPDATVRGARKPAPPDPRPTGSPARRGPGPRHRRATRHRWPRVLAGRRWVSSPAVGGLVVLIGLGLAALAWAEDSSVPPARQAGVAAAPPPAGPTAPASAAGRWLRVVDGLDAVRAAAYEHGDVALLARVWAPGTRLRTDSAQLQALLAAGCTARGVRHRFGEVTVLSTAGRRVRIRLVQWLPISQRVRHGEVVGELPSGPPTPVEVDILATDDGWRLA
ncbi:MAG TPA: protein kinase, partial [Mycobacteriales bacterium]|nr:protein kinase [Mycobacteriales bacterium]